MKYLVSTAAMLRFVDGSQIELVPGIHSFDKQVAEHWAFGAHAKAVDDSEIENLNSDSDLTLKVNVLEAEITGLKAQVALITSTQTDDGKAAVAQPDAEQETGNAKKQSSSNK